MIKMAMYSLKNNYDCTCIIPNKEIVVAKCYIVYAFKMVVSNKVIYTSV